MNLTRYNNDSPFDCIRHYDENGNEFWLARELMAIMGYSKWDAFLTAIERAIENMELAGDNVENNASDYKEPSGKTNQERLNYRLSRYGAYMVALACDGRKKEVALAKKYFAVKTREAEVIIPQQNEALLLASIELEKLKLENENLRLKTNYMERRNAIQELHGVQMLALLDGDVKVIEKTEKVTETVICQNGRNVSFVGKSTAEMGKELGFKSGKEFEHWLIRNKQEHLICQGMRAVQASYVPEENITAVKELFAKTRKTTTRQTVIGE